VGRRADGHIVVGITEATKSTADVYSPVSGQVAETNADIKQSPELINTNPYGRGWLVTVQGAPGQLGSADGRRRLPQLRLRRGNRALTRPKAFL